MTPAWFRQFARKLLPIPTPPIRTRRSRYRPALDQLEDRTVPVTNTWNLATGGAWVTPANWSLGHVPTSTEDVMIPDLAGSQTITSSANVTILSLKSGETVSITGGTFQVNGNFTNAATSTGTVSVAGGTLTTAGTNWTNAEAFSLSSGTVNFGGSFTTAGIGSLTRTGGTVNLRGALDNTGAIFDATAGGFVLYGSITGGTINAGGQAFTIVQGVWDGVTFNGTANTIVGAVIRNDLVLNGTINVITDGGLENDLDLNSPSGAANQQITTTSAGTIVVNAGTNGNTGNIRQTGVSHTVTIGTGVTVSGRGLRNTFGGGQANGPAFVTGQWVNNGTIEAVGVNVAFPVAAGNTITNNGTLQASNRSTLDLGAGTTLTNNGTIVANTSGALNLSGTWNNLGSITASTGTVGLGGTWTTFGAVSLQSGGTLNMGGSFTTATWNTVTRTGGTVNLRGALDNTGAIFDATAGGFVLYGSITGGTINAGGQAFTIVQGVWDGVTFNGTANTIVGAVIRNDLVLNGTINVITDGGLENDLDLNSPSGAANQQITTTSAGTIVVNAGTNGNTGNIRQTGVSHTVTIGTGVTVSGRGLRNTFGGGQANGPAFVTGQWVNNGTIEAVGVNVAFPVAAGNTITNNGTLQASNRSTLDLGTTVTSNSGTLAVNSSGILNVTASWTSTGSILVSGGTFNIGGTWGNTGAITTSAGTLNLGGNWTNTGTGTINVTGGTLNLGGSFTSAGIGTWNRTGGTVNLTGTLTGGLTLDASTGSWDLRGGTISGGTITTDATNALRGGAFNGPGSYLTNGVTIAAGSVLDYSVESAHLNVVGGLTIDGTLRLGNASDVRLLSAQTIAGTGTVVMGTAASPGSFYTDVQGPIAFTFGPSLAVRGPYLNFRGEGSAASNVTYDLQGPVTVEAGGGGFSTASGVSQLNTGGAFTVSAGAAATINAGTWTNTGTVTALANSTLTSNATSALLNTGAINSTNGTVNLGGSFTQAGLGTFTRTGSTVNLTGTLTGGLTLDASTGSWYLRGGTISGGTITTDATNALRGGAFNGPGSYLTNGVTIAAGSVLDYSVESAHLNVVGGLTIDGTLRLGNASDVRLLAAQTIAGTGTVVMGTGASPGTFYTAVQGPITFTFGPSLAIRGPYLNFRGEGSAASNVTYDLQGPVTVESGGSGFSANGVSQLNTGGPFTVSAGAAATINPGTWTNTGPLTTAGTTTVSATFWVNTGSLSLTAGTLDLGGSFTTPSVNGPGRFTRTGGTVNLTGILTNTGRTFDLTTGIGPVTLTRGGRIGGGTVVSAGASTLTAAGDGSGGTLDGVTIAAGSTVEVATRGGSSLVVVNGLTVDGTLQIGDAAGTDSAAVAVTGSQTFGGTGQIVYGGNPTNTIKAAESGIALTIGLTLTVTGSTGRVTGFAGLTNRGTIIADGAGELTFGDRTTSVNNLGTVRAVNGGTLVLPVEQSANLTGVTNVGNVYFATLNGGRWDAGASSTIDLMFGDNTETKYLRLTTLSADVRLDGGESNVNSRLWETTTRTNALTALTAVSGDGALSLTGGRSFTPIGAFVAAGGLTVGAGSTLTAGFGVLSGGGLTVNGSILGNVTVIGGTVHGTGELTGDVTQTGGVLAPGNSPGILDIVGDYALEAGGVLEIEIAGRKASEPVEYDQVRVTGTATLAGAVRVAYLDEFQPTPGDEFVVVSAGTLAPTVAATQFPGSGGVGRRLLDVYSPRTLTLRAEQLPPVEFGFVTPQTADSLVLPRGFTTDGYGNSYSTGYFYNTVDFDGPGPSEPVDSGPVGGAAYVAKYDPAGGLVWVRILRQPDALPQGAGVAVDTLPGGNGDVVFGGSLSPGLGSSGSVYDSPATISDGTTTLTVRPYSYTGNGGVAFVIRLTADGVPVWGRAVDGNALLNGLAIGPTGTVYSTGQNSSVTDFDPSSGGTANRNPGAFVWALNRAGNYVAAAVLTGVTEAFGYAITVSADDAVWVTGVEYPTGITNPSDAIVQKVRVYGTTFDTLVAESFGAEGNDYGYAVAVDPSGNVVVGGLYSFSVDFDASPGGAFTLPSNGEADGFLLSLTADGTFRWARNVGGALTDSIAGVSTDPAGNVYFGGLFRDAVDFDPGEDSYLLQTDYINEYVAKYDAAGGFLWAIPIQTQYPYGGAQVAADAAGRVFVTGSLSSTIDFDPGDGTYNLPFRGGYIWRLNQKGIPSASISGLPTGTPVEGDTLSVAAVVTDGDSDFFTYAWVVTRDGVQVATGAGPVLTVSLADQGTYAVTLTVTDDTGNRTTAAGSVAVSNAVPRLNATAFGPATQPAFNQPDILAAGEGQGASLAVGPDAVLVGSPTFAAGGLVNAGRAVRYSPAGQPFYSPFLNSPAPQADARFGASVAVVGNYYVVTAPGQNAGSGAVFVFDSFGQWVRTLAGSAAGDRFGASVAAVGGFVVVGAPGRTADTGVAYLFDPATGRLVQTFRNPTPAVGDEFGSALVAVGGGVLIGSPGDDSVGLDAGAAYLFDTGTGRVVRDLFNPFPSPVGGRFGEVLAASGTVAAVGVPADDSAGADAGGVHLYDLDPTTAGYGSLVGTVRSPSAEAVGSKFGSSVSLRGNRLLVGAPAEAGNSGRAYLFDSDPRSATYGQSLRTFATEFPTADDRFGAAVGIAGDNVFVGAPGFDAPGVVPDPPRPDAGQAFAFLATAFVTQSATAVTEGDAVTVSGSFTDAGAGDGHVATITWGNGASTRVRLAAGEYAFTATYRYVDDDPTGTASDDYPVRVAVQDLTPDLLVNYINPLGADVLSRADGTTGAAVPDFFYSDFLGGYGDQTGLRVGPDGLIYISTRAEGGGGDGPVYRLDPTTAGVIDEFIPSVSETDQTVNNLAFDPAGRLVRFDPTVGYFVRYDGATGAVVPAQYADLGAFNSTDPTDGQVQDFVPQGFAYGPDGDLYVANFYSIDHITSGILRFDGEFGDYLGLVPGSASLGLINPTELAFGPDGALYVSSDGGSGRQVWQLDRTTGRRVRTFEVGTPVSGRDDFLVDADYLYWSSPNEGTRRFSLATGESLGQFGGGLGGFLALLAPTDFTAGPITVSNAAPDARVVAAPNGTPGEYTLTALVEDAGTADTLTYSWTITGGTPVGPTDTADFSFAAAEGTSLTVTLTVTDDDGGTVTGTDRIIIGTDAADTITVTDPGDAGRVIVYGLGGDDRLNAAAATVPVELIGGFGDDTLVGGTNADLLTGNNVGDYDLFNPYDGDTGADSLVAGAGNDTLDGGLGDDTMDGGGGNDLFLEVPGSDDLLVDTAATGTDTVDYRYAFHGVKFTLAIADGTPQVVNPTAPVYEQHTVALLGNFENLTGSGYDDDLSGTAGDNDLRGGGGDDLLFGGGPAGLGSTVLGDGNDSLSGGAGNDTVLGGSGNDILFGGTAVGAVAGADDDSLVGGSGSDTVVGGTGNDILFGGDLGIVVGPVLAGGADADSLVGGAGNDTVVGGTGNDILFGGDPVAAVVGPDDDSLVGGAGSDTLAGGAGNDILFGGTAVATVAAPGNDSLVGGSGSDTVVGGSGNDILFGGDPLAVVASSIPDDDSLVGGAGNDTLLGGTGNDILFGGEPTATLVAAGNDSLVGGAGNDTVVGGTGNDILFGGDPLGLPATAADDDSLVGGAGNDTVVGGTGNDILFGGLPAADVVGPDNDSLAGGAGNDTVLGGAGNDILFGGEAVLTAPLAGTAAADDDSLVGGTGNDTLLGGAGNDILFGGVAVAGSAVPDADSLLGGLGNDTLSGGAGNDILFGGEGDDRLAGEAGTDRYEGGSGNDTVVEGADADVTLTGTQLVVGGTDPERLYDIDRAVLGGGAGDNYLSAATFFGPVTLVGGGGADTLVGGLAGDSLSGGSGDDSLVGGAGPDRLDPGGGTDLVDGGADNDTYTVALGGADTLVDASGIDFLDLSSTAFALDVDLDRPTVAFDTAGNTLTAVGAVENARGSGYADTIKGSGDRNVLEGGGGADFLDGRAGDDTVQGGFPQVVYLDFDSATGKGERVYAVAERNDIQNRLEKLFAAPFTVTFTQTPPSSGRFATLVVNAGNGEDNETLVAGVSSELDFRNTSGGGRSNVNVNGFLGRPGQPPATAANYLALTTEVLAHELGHLLGLRHSDAFGPLGSGLTPGLFARSVARDETVFPAAPPVPPPPGQVAYQLAHGPVLLSPIRLAGNTADTPVIPAAGTIFAGTAAAATFVVGADGTLALTSFAGTAYTLASGSLNTDTGVLSLNWLPTPPTSSVRLTYQYDPLRPGYRGPDDAYETSRHVLASPASVGTTVADALASPYFGERELIKLAFADAGRTVQTADLPAVSAPAAAGGTARDLGTLPALAVPNLLPAGAVNAGREIRARAVTAAGTLPAGGAVTFAVAGKANDLLTAEVLSESIRQRLGDTIDAVLTVRGPGGGVLDFYGRPAVADDGFDNRDPFLQDVRLPADGVYYVTVQAFSPTDAGSYELFLAVVPPPVASVPGMPRQGGEGDRLEGGDGADVLIGAAGDDRFYGTAGTDTFIGATADDVTGLTNRPPAATVTLNTTAPRTNDTLTATATGTDPDGDAVTFTYRWYVAGVLTQTTPDTPARTDTFDLSVGGHGSHGQDVTVTVTPADGSLAGTEQSATATILDTPPTATVTLDTMSPRTDDTLTATAAASDADGDAVTFTYRWYIGPELIQTTDGTAATTDTFDLAEAGHGDRGQVVRVEVTPRAFGVNGAFAEALASVANTPPTATDKSYEIDAGIPFIVDNPGLLAFAADADFDALTLVALADPPHGTVTGAADGSFVYTPAAGYVGPDAFAYTVSDGTDTATATVSVTVRSAARAVISGAPPGSVSEGTLVSLTGSVEPAGGSPATFAWTLARNGTPVASGTGTAFAFTPADDGVYLVTLTGTAGGLAVTPATATVTATNVAPTAATVTRSGATLADRVRVTVGLGGVADPSPADTTAGFRYSFATSVAGLATTWAGGQLTATATLDFARAAAVHTVYLRVLDDDDGFTDRTVRVVVGSDGADTLAGTAGVDVLFGLGGTDSLVGGGGDFLDGGAGTDTLVASAGGDQLVGGDGADSLFGGAGDDLLDGGAGADTLRAGAGDDVLGGGADADWLYAGAGADQLYGDAGADRLVGGPSPALLDGGADADTLSAGGAGDTLAGGDGTDSLVGGAGADSLLGGAGADRLDGGAGTDTLAGGSDADTLVGGAGADRLNGDDGDDVFWGWGGVFVDDTLAGGAGGDRVQNPGTAGGLTLAGFSPAWGVEQIAGAAGVGTQYVAGTAAAEVFDFAGVALTGIGYVDAGDGADRVVAGVTPGVEYRGGAGDDTLESGAGADKLTGGAGTDLFRMAASGGEDRVADFRRGQDRLDLRPLGVTGSQVSWVRSGADTLVTVQAPGGAFVVRLAAYTGTLDLTDFLFV